MPQDKFSDHSVGLDSPVTRMFPVIPDDATDLPHTGRALNVAQSGKVQITTCEGDTATVYVAAGLAFPVRAVRIWQTGTTATDIVVMY